MRAGMAPLAATHAENLLFHLDITELSDMTAKGTHRESY